jgi:flavin reductase (DIM6/NTAB) family NADH-FMN oxidoreductase RutF
MGFMKKILTKLNGLHYRQEYLCLANESFQNPIHAYFVRDGQVIKDITQEHLFTGYSPLVFTLISSDLKEPFSNIEMFFSQRPLQPNDFFKKKDALAWLSLRLIQKQKMGNNEIYYYEGIRGQHHFISFFHQYITGLNNQIYNKKKENVFLNNHLYKQVQIAYSVPRIISLITVGSGGLYNLFPTDLHGQVNEQYYVSSLRHGGKACKQVENAGRIVISQVHADVYKTVYALGKNHMQELRPKENFFFSESLSSVFKLPLPASLLSYKELELVGSFEHGIHTLLLYRIISSQAVHKDPSTLAHIHNSYATWRHRKGLPGNYLLR